MKISNVAALAALSAVLLVGTATSADAAPRGARFEYGMKTNSDLADLLQAAYDADSDGTRLLTPDKCAKAGDRSCASYNDFLVSVLKKDPNAQVDGVYLKNDRSKLPAFIRNLRMEIPPPGEYYMDCQVRTTNIRLHPSAWEPKEDCVVRYFRPGEMAYVDPDNGIVLFAQECDNPVGRPFKQPPCPEIDYPMDVSLGDHEVKLQGVGPTDLAEDHECPPMLLLPGETDWENAFIDRCKDYDCGFDLPAFGINDADVHAGDVGTHFAVSGVARLQVSRKMAEAYSRYRVLFCLRREDGSQSCGLGVQWFDFVPTKGRNVATIHYTKQEAEGVTTIQGQPTDLYWHFGASDCPDD